MHFSLDFVARLTDINDLRRVSRFFVTTVRFIAARGWRGSKCLALMSNHQGVCVAGTDVFLSYARQDRATARVIAECLRAEGFSVWWDASLHSGETFDEVIERNLKDSKAVVVLWSPASVASRWVRAEATLADRRNKLIPAIIDACDRPIIFELTHTAELIGWKGDISDVRWQTFVEDLGRLIKPEESEKGPAKDLGNDQSHAPIVAEFGSVSDAARSARQPLRAPSFESVPSDDARRENLLQRPKPLGTSSLFETEFHCLVIEKGEAPEKAFIVDSSGAKIGRMGPADIVIAHGSISREHCIVGMANDELLVTDLNSTNGTFIDDVRISRATILPVGSVLRVGEISLRHAIKTDGEVRPQGNVQGGRGTGHVGRLAAAS